MRGRRAIPSMAFVLVLGAPAVGRADAVTDCAKLQGKAYASYLSSVILAAGHACGRGSTAAPAAVSQKELGSSAAKFYAAVGKSVDQFGPASCVFTLGNLDDAGVGSDVGSFLDVATDAANLACLVPMEP